MVCNKQFVHKITQNNSYKLRPKGKTFLNCTSLYCIKDKETGLRFTDVQKYTSYLKSYE